MRNKRLSRTARMASCILAAAMLLSACGTSIKETTEGIGASGDTEITQSADGPSESTETETAGSTTEAQDVDYAALLETDLDFDGDIPVEVLDYPVYFKADFDRILGEGNWQYEVSKTSSLIIGKGDYTEAFGPDEIDGEYTGWNITWTASGGQEASLYISNYDAMLDVAFRSEDCDSAYDGIQYIAREIAGYLVDALESEMSVGLSQTIRDVAGYDKLAAAYECGEFEISSHTVWGDTLADNYIPLILSQGWTCADVNYDDYMELVEDRKGCYATMYIYNFGEWNDDTEIPDDIWQFMDGLTSVCEENNINLDFTLRLCEASSSDHYHEEELCVLGKRGVIEDDTDWLSACRGWKDMDTLEYIWENVEY